MRAAIMFAFCFFWQLFLSILSIISVARYARSLFLYINFLYRRPSIYIEEPVYILYSNSLSCIGTLYRIKSFIYSIYTFFWFSLYICVWFSIYKLIYIILLLFFYFFARSLTLACQLIKKRSARTFFFRFIYRRAR